MPFIPHTPESLISRNDSKNPATTCKGITEKGRPCRRSLATSPPSSPLPKIHRTNRDGVLAVLSSDDEREGAAAFFCWQHKDQAATLQNDGQGRGNGSGQTTTLFPLTERTSIDTLVDRLGVLDVQDGQGSGRRNLRRKEQSSRPVRKETLPKKWQNVQGPLMALPENGGSSEKPPSRRRTENRRRPGFWESLCCMGPAYDSPSTPPAKPRQHPTTPAPPTVHPAPTPNRTAGPPPAPTPRTTSHTQTLLSLIPPTLSPQTTSALLAELAKPVSAHDEEGWIYIFWLTPHTTTAPDAASVSSLLAASPQPQRRASEVLSQGSTASKTILLKIGRASNVQRRMNEWTKQCGYNLSLVRYYPYLPSSPIPSPNHRRQSGDAPHKVPHAHKVERLIHLELADRRVKRGCAACGKEHREWFEVAGTREGVKGVDEVVRRWVGWAEGKM